MKCVLLAFCAAALAMAADATGKWTGQLSPADRDPGPALLLLKQQGNSLTGSVGPHADEQHPIQNGKAEDGTLTFEVQTGNAVMKFQLKQEGDEIKGDITREREGQTQTAKLEVKREKE